MRGVRAEEVEGALRGGARGIAGGARRGAAVRGLLIRYLRWSAKRHWSVKVATAVLVLPIYALTPAKAWARLVMEVKHG